MWLGLDSEEEGNIGLGEVAVVAELVERNRVGVMSCRVFEVGDEVDKVVFFHCHNLV
jgi:hypothetical protein